MFGKQLVVGRFFGIQLRIDYSWFLIFGLIAWSVIAVYLPGYHYSLGRIAGIVTGLIITVLFFASVVAHEYAHSLVANYYGLHVRRITLFMLGGASELQQEPESAKVELLVTAAGPMTSLGLAGLFGAAGWVTQGWDFAPLTATLQLVAALNFVVGLFNVLPAFPLDGGRILRSLIWLFRHDVVKATRNATGVSVALAYLMMGFGTLEIISGGIVGGVWLAIIGYFLLRSAQYYYVQTVYQVSLRGVTVRDLYDTHYVAVPGRLTTDTFLSSMPQAESGNYLITDAKNRPVGIIRPAELARTALYDPEAPIDTYRQPLVRSTLLRLGDPAMKAFTLMQQYGLDFLPVVWHQKLIGVLRASSLSHYVLTHRTGK